LDPNIGLFLGSNTITGEKIMKKFLLIMFVSLGWSQIFGQARYYPSILPRREKDYTIEEIKVFSRSGSQLSKSWNDSLSFMTRENLVEAIEMVQDPNLIILLNDALLEVEKNGSEYILDNIHYEYVEIPSFQNSYQDSGLVHFYPDKNFKGMVFSFKVEDFFISPSVKAGCANIIKAGFTLEELTPPENVVQESPKNIPTTSSLELAEMLVREDPGRYDRSPYVINSRVVQPKVSKTWIQRNWYIIPVGVVTVGAVVYLIVRLCTTRDGRIEEYDIRTMPGGIGGGIPVFAF
jgi:hypothetical protein